MEQGHIGFSFVPERLGGCHSGTKELEARQCWDLWEMGAKVGTFFRHIRLFGPLGASGAGIFCCNHLKWIVQGLNYQK